MLACGGVLFLGSTVMAVHDAALYWTLPEAYRSAINKLDQGWHYAGLPKDERAAVLEMHQKWENEERIPWWGADERVDPTEQREETLEYFDKFIPRWGWVAHQRYPLSTILLSLVGFAPFGITIAIARWIAWLRAPASP